MTTKTVAYRPSCSQRFLTCPANAMTSGSAKSSVAAKALASPSAPCARLCLERHLSEPKSLR